MKYENLRSTKHIPADLWPEILCSLPVKSLLRFRCVSKAWQALIGDPGFARLHLKSFKNNVDETHLLVVQGEQQDCVAKRSDTFETDSETLLTLGHVDNEGRWDIVCSIDGLVLLKRRSRVYGFNDLKVWNPSIRKFHEFPSPDHNQLCKVADICLGYDSPANDYKHVKLLCLDDYTVHLVAIYSLGSGSWKLIPFQGKGCSWHWALVSIRLGRKVHLRGSLHFIAGDSALLSVWDLVSFDLKSEAFSCTKLPDAEGHKELTLIDGGCSLAVFVACGGQNSIWALGSSPDGSGSSCWAKRYSFFSEHVQHFLYSKKNGDLLIVRRREILLRPLEWDSVESYNPETHEAKTLEQRKVSSYNILNRLNPVSSYIESLILLKTN